MYTISSGNVSGLVSGQTQVTISGVIDQTTKLLAAINGQYIVINVSTTNNTFQLQGTSATGTESVVAGTGLWSTSAGTIPYTLNFKLPSAAITNISNPLGKAITITTGSTVGLTPGEQITISGVTGGTQDINGTWTVVNIKRHHLRPRRSHGRRRGPGRTHGQRRHDSDWWHLDARQSLAVCPDGLRRDANL